MNVGDSGVVSELKKDSSSRGPNIDTIFDLIASARKVHCEDIEASFSAYKH